MYNVYIIYYMLLYKFDIGQSLKEHEIVALTSLIVLNMDLQPD